MAEDQIGGYASNAAFAVFDGHSGDKAAEFCSQNMVKKLLAK